MKVELHKIQSDIVMKALLLIAKEKGLDVPTDTLEQLNKAAARNPYETDLTDVTDVLETFKVFTMMNQDYK